jgi:leucyl/phenylalanyl-tRNA--protein transferase
VNAFAIEDLIECYRRGVFPMADARADRRVFLVDPARRGVLPMERFHVPRRLARTVRSDRFQVRVDVSFDEVVGQCAAPRPGRPETWINAPIQRLYGELFRRGLAHSVEAWSDGRLAGGLYGVALGGAFFGESMFSDERDASKVALTHLVARLIVGGFVLLDTQFITEHLTMFGAEEISRSDYLNRLRISLKVKGDFLRLPAYAGGAEAMQAISQAS